MSHFTVEDWVHINDLLRSLCEWVADRVPWPQCRPRPPPATREHGSSKVTFPEAQLFLCEKKKKFKFAYLKLIHNIFSFSCSHLCQTSDLFDADIESEQVQRLLAHCRQTWDRGAPLLHEGEVAVHPQLPLWLIPQLIHLCDLLPSSGGWAGLLEPRAAFGDGA